MKTTKEFINGYLQVEYNDNGFITISDTDNIECKVRLHKGVLKMINKTVRDNDKGGKLDGREKM